MASQLTKYKNQILKDLKLLPEDKIKEVIDFIGYLKNKEKEKNWEEEFEYLTTEGRKFTKEKKLKQVDVPKLIQKVRNK